MFCVYATQCTEDSHETAPNYNSQIGLAMAYISLARPLIDQWRDPCDRHTLGAWLAYKGRASMINWYVSDIGVCGSPYYSARAREHHQTLGKLVR